MALGTTLRVVVVYVFSSNSGGSGVRLARLGFFMKTSESKYLAAEISHFFVTGMVDEMIVDVLLLMVCLFVRI